MKGAAPETLNQLFFEHVLPHQRTMYRLAQDAETNAAEYTGAEFCQCVLRLRRHLLSLGLPPGARIAVLAPNRPEWHIADFAILLAGFTSVPIYTTLSPAQTVWILQHSEARAICYAGDTNRGLVTAALQRVAGLDHAIALDDEDRCGGMPSLQSITAGCPAVEPESVRSECLRVRPDDLATLIYTSGTTGQPKGVMLTHRNLCFDLDGCLHRLGFASARQALSVLPLAHVFERLLTYGYFRSAIPIAYGDPHDLKILLRNSRPEVLGCVPRILEKIRETVDSEIENVQPEWKRDLARTLIGRAEERAGQRKSRSWLADTLVFRRVRRQLPDLRYLVVGGAKLRPEIDVFFRAAGFKVLQGYGLTETSPVITLTGLDETNIGDVGMPLSGIEVRISENGEILTRGSHVMKGYWRDPQATAAAIDANGWFATGDLGSVDAEGRLTVTGRIKELLVLSTGKKVACAVVEQAIMRSDAIQHAFVVGNGRKFTAAVLIPADHMLDGRTLEEVLQTPSLLGRLTLEVSQASQDLAEHEQVKRFCLLAPDVLKDPELFTPTQKLRRHIFERRFADAIERLYTDDQPFVIPLERTQATAHAASH